MDAPGFGGSSLGAPGLAKLVLGSTSWQGRHESFRSCLKDYLAAGGLALGWMR